MANPFFSGRIPQNLDEKVKEFLKQSGKSKTEVLIEALSAYLNYPVEIKKTTSNEDIWSAVKELQEKVAVLEKSIAKTNVITHDNIETNAENNGKHNQLSLLDEIAKNDKEDNKNLKDKVLKTNEVPLLPGLKNEDPTQIKTKLRNANSQNTIPVTIGRYVLDRAGKEPGSKGALLWKILEDNN